MKPFCDQEERMHRRTIAREFDALAPEYEANRLSAWYTGLNELVLRALGDRRFEIALDVGCGTGWFLRNAFARGIIRQGVGVDASPEMVHAARAHSAGNAALRFSCGWWPDLSPEEWDLLCRSPADLVVCSSSAHYFEDLDVAFRRIAECAAPGATLMVVERAPELSLPTRAMGWVHSALLRDGARFHSTQTIVDALVRAGFRVSREPLVVSKLLWRRKIFTSVALVECTKSAAPRAADGREEEKP